MSKWPEITILWASEGDGSRRERILEKHSLLMKVVERHDLEAFRSTLGNPRSNWNFHLTRGLGYDLDHLEHEIEVAFGGRERSAVHRDEERFASVMPSYDKALLTLGEARRALREQDMESASERLLRVSEALYDRVEQLLGEEDRREFIEDGLSKTKAWLDRNDDQDGKVRAQLERLLRARQRLEGTSASDRRPA